MIRDAVALYTNTILSFYKSKKLHVKPNLILKTISEMPSQKSEKIPLNHLINDQDANW